MISEGAETFLKSQGFDDQSLTLACTPLAHDIKDLTNYLNNCNAYYTLWRRDRTTSITDTILDRKFLQLMESKKMDVRWVALDFLWELAVLTLLQGHDTMMPGRVGRLSIMGLGVHVKTIKHVSIYIG